jgi:hypothetical protein
MIDVNLRGVLYGIAAALPVFASQGHGHFVTVTSTSAIKWVPGQGATRRPRRACGRCARCCARRSDRRSARRWSARARPRSRGRSPSRRRSTSARSSCAPPHKHRARAAARASQSERELGCVLDTKARVLASGLARSGTARELLRQSGTRPARTPVPELGGVRQRRPACDCGSAHVTQLVDLIAVEARYACGSCLEVSDITDPARKNFNFCTLGWG